MDAQIKDVIQLLLRRRLIIRVDRMYKKAKPGKKRLAKWPKKMVSVRDRDLQVIAMHDHTCPATEILSENFDLECRQVGIVCTYTSIPNQDCTADAISY